MTFFIGHAFGLLRAESSFFPFGSQLCTSSPVFFHRYFLRLSANRRFFLPLWLAAFSSVMPLVSCEPKALSSPLAHSFFIGHAFGSLRTESPFFPFGLRLCIGSPVWCTRCWSFFIVFLSAFPYPPPTFPRKCEGYKTKSPSSPEGGRQLCKPLIIGASPVPLPCRKQPAKAAYLF